nr:hypothetical protein [Odoribacter splanchnicus]
MENTEKRPVSTEAIQTEQKKGREFNLTPSESVFFSQLEKSLKNHAADMTAPKPLEVLRDSFRRLGRLFISFERPWLTNCGIIQKACAWYLANGKPDKEESNRLLETLHGFTVSACLLSEWNELTHNMQAFFRTQEKELKRLFNYEQETERKHKEREERLAAEGTGYCLTIGKGEIYGVTYSQMEELYRVMGRFIEREKAPFQCKLKDYGEYNVSISKHVSLYADGDEFDVNYSLDNIDADFDWMPAGQLQRMANAASAFLKIFGENGERQVRWDIADYPESSQPDIAFTIKEDSRLPTFRSVPWINKYICQEENQKTEIEYCIGVNEIQSPELSFGEFMAVYRKLGEFLNNRS